MARSTTFGASVTTGLPDTWDTLCLPGITYQSYTLLHGHPQLFGSWGEEGKDRLLRTRPSNPLWEPNPYLYPGKLGTHSSNS